MSNLIFERMIEAQRLFGLGGIEKKDRNKFQNFNYRSVDSTIAAANAIFAQVGIFCIPTSTDSEWLIRDVLDKNKQPRTDFTLQARYTFTFYAEDGSSVAAAHIPCANTSQDDSKLLGQTLSYAYKEVLFKTFSIPVEGTEDVDSLDANRNQHQQIMDAPVHQRINSLNPWLVSGSEGYPLSPPQTLVGGEVKEYKVGAKEDIGLAPANRPTQPEASKRYIAKRNAERAAVRVVDVRPESPIDEEMLPF